MSNDLNEVGVPTEGVSTGGDGNHAGYGSIHWWPFSDVNVPT